MTISVLVLTCLLFAGNLKLHAKFYYKPSISKHDSLHANKNDFYEDVALEKETSSLKWTLMSFIRIYQKIFSPQYGPVCNFTPSCSHFGFEAFNAYDPLQAFLMTADRLERCNPSAVYNYSYSYKHKRYIDPVEHHNLWGTDPEKSK